MAGTAARLVALRKESVDRNTMRRDFKMLHLLSLSVRRAWIEIALAPKQNPTQKVALRKESVDRNGYAGKLVRQQLRSLSARRAWIEIILVRGPGFRPRSLSVRRAWIEIGRSPRPCSDSCVALRKESVDRNSSCTSSRADRSRSLSARRAWIEIPNRMATVAGARSRSPQGERG